jgi:hypothetical protein
MTIKWSSVSYKYELILKIEISFLSFGNILYFDKENESIIMKVGHKIQV